MDRSVLALLEEAELRARAARLRAATEAEERAAAASARLAAIERATPAAIERARAARRASVEAHVAAELATLERELADLPGPVRGTDVAPAADPRIDGAVELIVAAVLGEAED